MRLFSLNWSENWRVKIKVGQILFAKHLSCRTSPFSGNLSCCYIIALLIVLCVTLYQTTKFYTCPNWKHLQTINECDSKFEICFGKDRKHAEKRIKCWLPALFPFCTMFSKAFIFRVVKCRDCVVNGQTINESWVSVVLWYAQPFPKQALVFTCLQHKSFENTVGKGEIARDEQFLLFPQCFLPIWTTFCHFNHIWNCRLQTLWIWKSLKFVVWERVKIKWKQKHSAQVSLHGVRRLTWVNIFCGYF